MRHIGQPAHSTGKKVRGRGRAPSKAPRRRERLQRGAGREGGGQWADAETDFRQATKLKPIFPEAWSELGHALKKRGLYDDSVKAYQEALRLRPQFPQAMEYLGETYTSMGKRPEAQQMLDRLRPLDPTLAVQLEQVMSGGGSGY
jgi:tetratricopeptide (TPR) repeat protein